MNSEFVQEVVVSGRTDSERPGVEGQNYFNYFTEIEETFVRRRGKNLLLSPIDWALIEDWQDRGIPLHIVTRAIDTVFDVFDSQPERPRTIKSLFYCREEIEAQYQEWLKMQIGQAPAAQTDAAAQGVESDVVADHVSKVRLRLERARSSSDGCVEEAIGRVLNRLDELLATPDSTERLEKSLEGLDSIIDTALLESPRAKALSAEVGQMLAPYKSKMDKEAYKRTFDLMLLKKLREDAELPRFSLFHL